MEGRPVTEDDSRESEKLTLGSAVFGRKPDPDANSEAPGTFDTPVPDGPGVVRGDDESTSSIPKPDIPQVAAEESEKVTADVPIVAAPAQAAQGIATPEEAETAAVPDDEGGWGRFTQEAALLPDDQVNEPPEETGAATKKERRRWPWITAAAVLVVAGAYVGAAFYYADRVPTGTEVAGVQMGGLDRKAAAAKLQAEVVDQVNQPVEIQIVGESGSSDATPQATETATNANAQGDGTQAAVVAAKTAESADTITVVPADYSLSVDENATVDSMVGFSLNPVRMWAHIAGGKNVDPVYTYDEDKLSAEIETLATQANREASNAAIAYDGTKAVLTEGQTGLTLDEEAAHKVLAEEILTVPSPVELTAKEVEPAITTDAAKEVLTTVAEPLVASKMTVSVKDQTADLTPEQLAAAATFAEKDGALALTIDGEKLADIVSEAMPDVLTPGKDATIEIVDHTTPKITESEDGIGIGADDVAKAVTEKAGATTAEDRTITLEPTTVPAAFTTEDAQKMGVKEVVSEIQTPLTDDAVRTTNLQVGTAKITNTLVKPGDTFSLETALGPITAENGFVASGVVANGFNSEAMGGGLSQLSTNTFNIGYLAGMKDVEHKPHSKYFERYPMGREATLWEGTIDMKWQNNTPYGAVIDTWVADGYVHSQLWSTKYWDVQTSTSDPYNYVSPTTKNNPAADCEPSGAGGSGFTVDVSRTISHDGTTNDEDSGGYSWTYSPVDAVTCN